MAETYQHLGAYHDLLIEVSEGHVPGHSIIHKFGGNPAVGTTYVPIAEGGVYPTPSSVVSLEFISDDAADAVDDTGMHELTIIGLDANWNEQTVVVAAHATTGLTAVTIPGTWFRIFRAFVSKSGVYATFAQASHVGKITIRVASAGATWAIIDDTLYPRGQTEIGLYTVPNGKTAYLMNAIVNIATTKIADVMFFQRPNADDVTTPFTGTMRIVFELGDIAGGEETLTPSAPIGPFVGPCDLGFMARVTQTTGEVNVDFELLLVDN